MRRAYLERTAAPPPPGPGISRRALFYPVVVALRFAAASLAILLVLALLISSTGLIDWQQLSSRSSEPWNSLISPDLSPRTLYLDAGGALLFLAMWASAMGIGTRRA